MSRQPNNHDSGSELENPPMMSDTEQNSIYRMVVNWLENRMLWLSKTDMHALQFCTDETRHNQIAIGVVVLITGIMALMSSYFALQSTVFSDVNGLVGALGLLFIPMFYAFAIIIFDREVVSATDKRAALLRIPFAILIGLVISAPIELKLQQGRIDVQITKTVEENNAGKLKLINTFDSDRLTRIDKAYGISSEELIKSLTATNKQITDLILRQNTEYGRKDRPGIGGNYNQIVSEISRAEEKRDTIQGQINKIDKNKIAETIDNELKDKAKEIEKLRTEIAHEKNAHDLLTQMEALYKVRENSSTAATMGWILTLFLVFFELFPALTKLFVAPNEYHAYLDARRRVQRNKIFALSSRYDGIMQEEIQDISSASEIKNKNLLVHEELTDFLEEIMEDRQKDRRNPRDGHQGDSGRA